MNAQQLIGFLKTMPPDAEVGMVVDGAIRYEVEAGWLARNGEVALASIGQRVQVDEHRPADAPSLEERAVWIVEPSPALG